VVRKQVTEWARQNPDEVILGAASSGASLTREAIRHHVETKTNLGQKLLSGWMDAAVRSVLNAKIKE